MLNAPAWLTARPIAHRGLHDKSKGVLENSPSAARAAIAHNFAIECDVQLTRDGEAMVFHDFTLHRLMLAKGRLSDHTAAEIGGFSYAAGPDRIITLAAHLALLAGKVPLVCEIKSRFDADMRLTDRVLEVAAGYNGPLALKSFDPAIIAHLRQRACPRPLGIIALRIYDDPEWASVSTEAKYALSNFLHYNETRPDFLSYWVADLPSAIPMLCRAGLKMPVMTWTVRTPEQRAVARQWADQMVFEGFVA